MIALQLIAIAARRRWKYEPAKRNKGQPKLTIGGVSAKFKRMAEVYKTFAEPWHHTHDFSDKALIDLYNSESYGTPFNEGTNGYSLGKKWLNVTVKMWLEDIELGTLYKFELYEDPRFPSWFLDGVLKGVQQKTILRM